MTSHYRTNDDQVYNAIWGNWIIISKWHYLGLTTCLLYVGRLLGNLIWNYVWFMGLSWSRTVFFIVFDYDFTYVLVSHNMIMPWFHLPYFYVSKMLYFSHSTLVLSVYMDIILTLYITHTNCYLTLTPGPPFTLIPAWICNYVPSKVWDKITYPFLNFNGATVEV